MRSIQHRPWQLPAVSATGLCLALHLTGCSADRADESPHIGSTRLALSGDRSAVDGFFAPPASFALPSGSAGAVVWRYHATSELQIDSQWNQPQFDDSSWSTGSPGFSYGGSAPEDEVRTAWPAEGSHLWLRTTFEVSSDDIPNLVLWGRWDDTMEVYINGVQAAAETEWSPGYTYLTIADAARQAISGTTANTLAVHVADTGGARYADLGVVIDGRLNSRPKTGCEQSPALAAYTQAVEDFMVRHAIPAGVLAVTKGDDLVVSRGFGWADKHFSNVVQPNAPMRLASVDKVVTNVVIQHLIDAGTYDPATSQVITDDTPVFPLLAAHGLTPIPGMTPDPRINTVTIRQLREHVSGVRELPDPEQLYQDLQIAPGTSTGEDNLRWTYSMPLEFDPGVCPRESCYNSNGYAILRWVVQKLEGDYLQYLRDEVAAAAGNTEHFISHERLEGRAPHEPWYATLHEPYDRWIYLENFLGGVASAPALVKFLRRYGMDTNRSMFDENGNWSPVNNGYGVFFGAMSGSWSVVMQRRWDGVNLAVVFNRSGKYDALHDQLLAITDSLPASAWEGNGCSEPSPLSAQVRVTTDFGTGYCVVLDVHNGASSATQSWSVSVNVPQATIYTSWNGNFSTNTGSIGIEPAEYLRGLQAGSTTSDVGFCANRTTGSSALPTVIDTSATY